VKMPLSTPSLQSMKLLRAHRNEPPSLRLASRHCTRPPLTSIATTEPYLLGYKRVATASFYPGAEFSFSLEEAEAWLAKRD
jgi:hypothetical protein